MCKRHGASPAQQRPQAIHEAVHLLRVEGYSSASAGGPLGGGRLQCGDGRLQGRLFAKRRRRGGGGGGCSGGGAAECEGPRWPAACAEHVA